jgi:hypothetical protein
MSETPEKYAVATRATEGADILRTAMEKGADVATLDRLLGLVERERANQAEAAYNAAVVEFQGECPIIDKGDKANGMPFARMDRIWRAIRPLMAQCGLAVTWESVEIEADTCRITGCLRHRLGHTVPLCHRIPMPEGNRGTNAAQRAGSAETYAKRYAICSALGIQTGDDDDGNAGGPTLDDGAKCALMDAIGDYCKAHKRDRAQVERDVLKTAKAVSFDTFPTAAYGPTMKLLGARV